jgi:fatty acid desaturase
LLRLTAAAGPVALAGLALAGSSGAGLLPGLLLHAGLLLAGLAAAGWACGRRLTRARWRDRAVGAGAAAANRAWLAEHGSQHALERLS